jgi:hypothetical protein
MSGRLSFDHAGSIDEGKAWARSREITWSGWAWRLSALPAEAAERRTSPSVR